MHVVISLLVDPSSRPPTPFKVMAVLSDICLTHYVVSHILAQNKHNFENYPQSKLL